MTKPNIRAVIFDFGGVLMRTESYAPREKLAQQFGITRLQLEDIVFGSPSAQQAYSGEIPVSQHFDLVRQRFNLSPAQMPAFFESFWGGDHLDAHLISMLTALRSQVHTGLLSNAWDDMRDLCNSLPNFMPAFEDLVISAECRLSKPDARIYHLAASRLGVEPSQAVFVDDMPHNVEGAIQAGLSAIRFTSTAQTCRDLAALLPNFPPQYLI